MLEGVLVLPAVEERLVRPIGDLEEDKAIERVCV